MSYLPVKTCSKLTVSPGTPVFTKLLPYSFVMTTSYCLISSAVYFTAAFSLLPGNATFNEDPVSETSCILQEANKIENANRTLNKLFFIIDSPIKLI